MSSSFNPTCSVNDWAERCFRPEKEERPVAIRIVHRIEMVLKEIGTLFLRFYDRLRNFWKREQFLAPERDEGGSFVYPETKLPWNAEMGKGLGKKGLNLFIHGLRGSPLHWSRYLAWIEGERPNMHTLAPHVPLEGNCSIETAAAPFLKLVENYLAHDKDESLSVNITGTSNGGRIALYIESHLDPQLLGKRKLSVVSIAGVHGGTQLINRVKEWGLLWFAGLHPDLAREFEWGSDSARDLLASWNTRQVLWKKEGCSVKHLFCASPEDDRIFPMTASLPNQASSNGVQYGYLTRPGESHISLVECVRTEVLGMLFSEV